MISFLYNLYISYLFRIWLTVWLCWQNENPTTWVQVNFVQIKQILVLCKKRLFHQDWIFIKKYLRQDNLPWRNKHWNKSNTYYDALSQNTFSLFVHNMIQVWNVWNINQRNTFDIYTITYTKWVRIVPKNKSISCCMVFKTKLLWENW